MGSKICTRCLSIEISQHHVEVCQNRKPMSWHTDKLIADAARAESKLQEIRETPSEPEKVDRKTVSARAVPMPQLRGQ
jgi:hypothetical protein